MYRDTSIHRPKLTPAQVSQIKALLQERVTQVAIAQRFGVSQTTVQFISSGKTWRDVK